MKFFCFLNMFKLEFTIFKKKKHFYINAFEMPLDPFACFLVLT